MAMEKNECSSKIGLSLNFCMLISETLIWSRFHDLDRLGSRSGGCCGSAETRDGHADTFANVH